MSIYVEIRMRAALEELWRFTQSPDLHARWDLRFTSIEYCPRAAEAAPQQFLYTTRVGFGIAIEGQGETVGTRDDGQGGRSSALRFWSGDPKSLILEGSGYWKYISSDGGVRFLTLYDYRTRFGALGRLADRVAFRPLLGWATAWSFDRLRLWLDKGIEPSVSMQRSVVHAVARLALAFVWLYQGIVPKLLWRASGELELLREAGLSPGWDGIALTGLGLGETVMGLLTLVFWRRREMLLVTMCALALLSLGAGLGGARVLTAPFNPVVLNVALLGLALVGLVSSRDLPSASRCLRRPAGE